MNARLLFPCMFAFGIGLAAGVMLPRTEAGAAAGPVAAPQLIVRLHRVAIRPDQLGGYVDWLAFLHARHADAVATLDREHMFVEAMFRQPDDPRTLYWLEVRDTQGAKVETSTADIDAKHQAYMKQVLLPGSWSHADAENLLVAPFVERAIAGHAKVQAP